MHRHLTRVICVASALLVCAVSSAPPAAALTGNEKFTMAVYEDFLLRAPTSSELGWWSGFLNGGGTRTAMAANVLGDDEFKTIWVLGASQYYLGGTNSQLGTVTANLLSSGDFVASEVALLAGSTYYSQNGSSSSGYVTALYQDVLLRNGSSSEITYWVAQITSGTRTRAWVARYFIRSGESGDRRVGGTAGMTTCSSTVLTDTAAITAGTYCLVLDRLAGSGEISYWSGQLAGPAQLPSLWSSVAGSTEYYNNAQLRF